MNTEQLLLHLQAQHDLQALSARYCNGVDRRDLALLQSLWWPEAHLDFGVFAGPARKFCELIASGDPAVEVSFHFTANALFQVDGEQASGSSYVITVSALNVDGVATQQLLGGRYLDQYQRRDGVWKFSERLFVLDWNINQPSAAVWDAGIGAMARRGWAGPDDPAWGQQH